MPHEIHATLHQPLLSDRCARQWVDDFESKYVLLTSADASARKRIENPESSSGEKPCEVRLKGEDHYSLFQSVTAAAKAYQAELRTVWKSTSELDYRADAAVGN